MAEPDVVLSEVILFELKNFHGAHKHIFERVLDLRTVGEPAAIQFADKTQSIVVVKGTWVFWEHQSFTGDNRELGPGRYPDVAKQHIAPKTISSLEPKL